MDTRDKIQQEVVEAFMDLPLRKGTIVLGTGLGKAKIAIDLIRRLLAIGYRIEDIYLFTSEKSLRDDNWNNEFKKFGVEWWIGNINSFCYQAAYKWKGKEIPVAIMDEVDFMVTPEYIKLIENNLIGEMLCMTGFLPRDKANVLARHAPIFYKYTTLEAQANKVLNPSRFIFVEYPLSNVPSIEVKKRDGSTFYQSENGMYRYLEKKFLEVSEEQLNVQTERIKSDLLGDDEAVDKWSEKLDEIGLKLDYAIRRRREFLLKLESSVRATKAVIDNILSEDGRNKVVTFSKLTKQSSLVCPYTYNSANNTKENDNVEKLNDGRIRVLGLCKSLGRGQNFTGVNYVIRESYDGSEVDLQQTHGRLTRLSVSETGTYIVMVPTYTDMVEVDSGDGKLIKKKTQLYTQARSWAENMLSSFNVKIEVIGIDNLCLITEKLSVS